MRVLLFTGKGGVGKTTVAAATAALAASRGRKVLVLSSDTAHSLGDAFGRRLGAEPTEVDTGLYAMHVDTQAAFTRSWSQIQGYLSALLTGAGVDELQAQELSVLPGAEEVLSLLELRTQVAGGRFDLVVVDCAPTGETLRLLALPEVLAWYVERLFPVRRRVLRAAAPLLPVRRADTDGVLAALGRLHGDLAEVRALLTAPATSVRLVLTPEAVVVAEARRALSALTLYGYRVDAVVANRVFPSSDEPFLAAWSRAQAEQLAAVRRDMPDLPVHEQGYRVAEPVGLPALTELGRELYGDRDPAGEGDLVGTAAERVERTADGFRLHLALPLASREDVHLARSGDDLLVTLDGRRHRVLLPSVLRRCEVVGGSLADGRLVVRFVPDPEQWPEALAGSL